MGATFGIKLSPAATGIVQGMQTLSPRLLKAVAQGMDEGAQMAVGQIQATRLVGTGPFPVSEHRLGKRTARLFQAMWAAKSVVNGDQVVGGVGNSVHYAHIHEFGGTIKHAARSGKVRLQTDASGNLKRQPGRPHLAVFARTKRSPHKRFREVAFSAAAHETTMPARAPIWTGLQENSDLVGQAISRRVVKTFPQ